MRGLMLKVFWVINGETLLRQGALRKKAEYHSKMERNQLNYCDEL